MSDSTTQPPENRPAFVVTDPDRLVGRGHQAGDFLEAYEWLVLDEAEGYLKIQAHLPTHALNPRGQLFGGFTPTYVDLVSLYTVHSDDTERNEERRFLSTINMRCDYFEPVLGPTFTIRGELENQRGKTSLVSTKFFNGDTMLVHAITTMRAA